MAGPPRPNYESGADQAVWPTLEMVKLVNGGAAIQGGRAVLIDCTVTGTFIPVFANGSTATIHLQANTVYEFNWSIISWSGTQTGAVYNEY